MNEVVAATKGIQPAQTGALRIVQQNQVGAEGSELTEACVTLSTYQRPTEDQADRYLEIGQAAAVFLNVVARLSPPGPERSTAISRIREARMWANAGIALEGK